MLRKRGIRMCQSANFKKCERRPGEHWPRALMDATKEFVEDSGVTVDRRKSSTARNSTS
jgi:hypothetical protein